LADMTLLVSRLKIVFKIGESRWVGQILRRAWVNWIDQFQLSIADQMPSSW